MRHCEDPLAVMLFGDLEETVDDAPAELFVRLAVGPACAAPLDPARESFRETRCDLFGRKP